MKQIINGIFAILDGRERTKLWQLIVFDLVIGLLDVAFLGLLLLIVNFYTSGVVRPAFSFLPAALANQNSLLLIIIFLILFSLKNWFGFIGLKFQHHFFYNVASRLAKKNLGNYLTDDYIRFINIDSSVLVRKISQQPIEFSHYVLTNFQQVISQSMQTLFTVAAILIYRPSLFLLLMVLLMPPVTVLAYLIRNKLKAMRADTKVATRKAIQHLHESLSGYVESNVYGKNDFFINRYHSYQQQQNNNIASQQTLYVLPSRLIEVCAVLGFFILIAVNKWSTGKPAIDLLTIGIFMASAYKIIPGIVKILNSTGQMRTYGFTVNDLLHDVQMFGTPKAVQPAMALNSISFHKVCFKYNDHPVLSNFSFDIKRGDFVGFSGSSGRGKTTIINLLLGFLEEEGGSIMINNESVSHVDRRGYWNRVSYVKQQPFFIHDTILKNITLSDSGHDSEKLADVLSTCGIDTLLQQYPEGLEKVISENGKNISGGQRQRIALARALYHDHDLLILDEPFSEMDAAAEYAILEKLKPLTLKGKMMILITHNQASLSFCNKIISPDGA